MKILNYQGSKEKLIGFIDASIDPYLVNDKAIFDIFSGGGSISAHFANTTTVYANDVELYAYNITKSLLEMNKFSPFDTVFHAKFTKDFNSNYSILTGFLSEALNEEEKVLQSKNRDDAINFYNMVPTLWNHGYSKILSSTITDESIEQRKYIYSLFTLLYSNNYFGLKQAIEIDSIRYAIENVNKKYNKSFLFSSLYAAMNMCVFSKDGHMAQPLNNEKYSLRMIKRRNRSIISEFNNSVSHYDQITEPISQNNQTFNMDFLELLKKVDLSNVGCIYADPPYTDMQYSRYYHLLNTVTEYRFAHPTIVHGKYSSGLYLDNRFQSEISTRGTFLTSLKNLCLYCKEHKINFVLSFAYPSNTLVEKTDRYLASIDQLIDMTCSVFGRHNVTVKDVSYLHSNQRQSSKKKVQEYLILCKGG